MLAKQIILGSFTTILNVIFHVICLVLANNYFSSLLELSPFWKSQIGSICLLSAIVMVVILVHTIEAWIWAALYLLLGEFSTLHKALYFSAVTGTSLGYGDITLSERWQILGTLESMGGLLLFGTSVAFLIKFLEMLFI